MTWPFKPTRHARAMREKDDPAARSMVEEPWVGVLRVPDPDVRASLGNLRALFDWLGIVRDHVALGGGTNLTLRWRHRTSKDVNFVCPPVLYEHGCTRLADPHEREALHEHTGIEVTEHDHERIHWVDHVHTGNVAQDGTPQIVPVTGSLHADEDYASRTRPGGSLLRLLPRESDLGYRLAPTACVLHAKVVERTLVQGQILPRDMYDVLVATRSAPTALMQSLYAYQSDDLKDIGEQIRACRAKNPQWNGTGASPRDQAVIDPRYEALTKSGLWDAAERLWIDEAESWTGKHWSPLSKW